MNLERSIARQARELVEEQMQNTPDHVTESEYRSLCESLPILLRTAGLTRAVTFLDAKKKDKNGRISKEGELLNHIQQQLQSLGVGNGVRQDRLDLPRMLTSQELSTADYRHLSSLAFRVAYWHKRMAQALLRPREGGR